MSRRYSPHVTSASPAAPGASIHSANGTPIANRMSVTVITVRERGHPNLSITAVTMASTREIALVTPRTTIIRKNTKPSMFPPGNVIAPGQAMNANPIPPPPSTPTMAAMGKIASPAVNAKVVSSKLVEIALLVSSPRRGR